jgi:hypothetical protein
MSDDNQTNQSCGGKKKAMLAYGIVQISADSCIGHFPRSNCTKPFAHSSSKAVLSMDASQK